MAVINLIELNGKDVYTKNGKYIGKIDDTMLDTEKGSVYGIVIGMAKESFLYKMFEQSGEGKKAILIPHRHIISADDIVLISIPPKYEKGAIASQESAEAAPQAEGADSEDFDTNI